VIQDSYWLRVFHFYYHLPNDLDMSKLDNPTDVDKQLIDWLINAYMIDAK